jgi:NADH-quinone oxidoreductase subunit C
MNRQESTPQGASDSAAQGRPSAKPSPRERMERCHSALTLAFGPGGRYESWDLSVSEGRDMPSMEVRRGEVSPTIEALRDDPALAFDQLSYLTATDELPEEPRFRLVYFLASTKYSWRLKVHTKIAEADARVRSIVSLHSGANWMEREVYDMFGIRFEGHPELKRILMPEEYGHHPLRKDFPIEGIQPDRLYREWEAARNAAYGEGRGAGNGR